MEITTPNLAVKHHSTPIGLSVKAAEIHHVPQLQCFGYTFREPWSQPRPLDVDAARALGVTSNETYRVLKAGFPALSDDGNREVHPDQVCGEAPRPRKITVLGDCCLIPPAMENLALNSDVLIHEATLSITDRGQKASAGGHSTAAQAAIFANKVSAQVLLLNHLPTTMSKFKVVRDCLSESESRIGGLSRVQLGYDHMEVLIPRRGFNFEEAGRSKSLWYHESEGNDADEGDAKPQEAS